MRLRFPSALLLAAALLLLLASTSAAAVAADAELLQTEADWRFEDAVRATAPQRSWLGLDRLGEQQQEAAAACLPPDQRRPLPRPELSLPAPSPQELQEAAAANSIAQTAWFAGGNETEDFMLRVDRYVNNNCSGPVAETTWMHTKTQHEYSCQQVQASDRIIWAKNLQVLADRVTFENCSDVAWFTDCEFCSGGSQQITWPLDSCLQDPELGGSHAVSLVPQGNLSSGTLTYKYYYSPRCRHQGPNLSFRFSPERPCVVSRNWGVHVGHVNAQDGWYSWNRCGEGISCEDCATKAMPVVGQFLGCSPLYGDEDSMRVTWSPASARLAPLLGGLGGLLALVVAAAVGFFGVRP